MKRGIYFEVEKDYLKVSLSGNINISDIEKYAQITKDECDKNGLSKVLVDGLNTENSNFTIVDSFLLGDMLSEIFHKKNKIVILWPKENIHNILETVASNKGVEILVTHDIVEGLQWLLPKKRNKWSNIFNSTKD